MQISLIAAAHRTKDWMAFYNSIHTNLQFEVIFVGEKNPDFELPFNFHYIYSPVKPAQCAEIALRKAKGEVISWTADDAEYGPFALDKAYEMYKAENNYKCMISFRIMEQAMNGIIYDRTDVHYCCGLKAVPFGFISKQFIDEIGGYDINFIAGQCENDMILRGWVAGGYVKVCDEAKLYNLENKHALIERNFQPSRPYEQKFIQDLWADKDGKFTGTRITALEPFKNENLLTVNQGPAGIWDKI